VLRRIYGPQREQVAGVWGTLCNEKLHNFYSPPNNISVIKPRTVRWVGHAARMGEMRNAHRVFVGKAEGKRSFGIPRFRWEDNIKMDLKEVGCEDVDWINLVQHRD
jgi:hypothetical protein